MNILKWLDKLYWAWLVVGGGVIWYLVQNIVFKDTWRKCFFEQKRLRLMLWLISGLVAGIGLVGSIGFSSFLKRSFVQSWNWNPATIEPWSWYFSQIGLLGVTLVVLYLIIKKIISSKQKKEDESSKPGVKKPKEVKKK